MTGSAELPSWWTHPSVRKVAFASSSMEIKAPALRTLLVFTLCNSSSHCFFFFFIINCISKYSSPPLCPYSITSKTGLPNPGIEPRSPSLQAYSLPAEPPGKPESTRMGSLSLLQEIFLTQESTQGFLHCRQIVYHLSYHRKPPLFFLYYKL